MSHEKGVILFGGHFTTFEIGGRILASRFEVGATYRPHNDPWWDSTLRAGRLRYLAALVPHDNPRAMIRYLGPDRHPVVRTGSEPRRAAPRLRAILRRACGNDDRHRLARAQERSEGRPVCVAPPPGRLRLGRGAPAGAR